MKGAKNGRYKRALLISLLPSVRVKSYQLIKHVHGATYSRGDIDLSLAIIP